MGPGRLRPYTEATALSSGWVWDIPLFERSGSGYVYASSFLDPEQAESDLRAYLGSRAEGLAAKHLTMRIGRTARAWVGNTVAIGLAAGFLEPLESTGIFLTEYQLGLLATLWPGKQMAQARQDRYNRAFAARYEELRDFIVLHYILSQRDDSPFWRAARAVDVPVSLRERLSELAAGFPELDALQPPVFRSSSWAAVMAGMEAMPKTPHPLVAQVETTQRQAFLSELRAEGQELAAVMPDHWEYIAAMQQNSQ